MADGMFVPAFKVVLITLKLLSVIGSLALFSIAAGWLRGADNLLFPGLGLIVATPLLIILLAIIEILLVIAFGILSALMS